MGWFQGIFEEIDVTNRWHVQNEKNRLVPFSTVPFRHASRQNGIEASTAFTDAVRTERRGIQIEKDDPHFESDLRQRSLKASASSNGSDEIVDIMDRDKWEDEPVGVRPPDWLELSGDLIWTSTFSTLTSNTVIEGPSSITSYMVFFILTWHLWATQVIYDVKYYTNDWWHRLFFILQLTVYAALAGLSNNFNVWWGFNTAPTLPFTDDDPTLTAEAVTKNAELTLKDSFQDVNIVFCISRIFLFLQYLRILYYRRKAGRMTIVHLFIPGALLISALLFLTCFLLLTLHTMSRGVAVAQVVLWFLSIAVQIVATILTPDEPKDVFKSFGSLTSRLSTLTVVVLGEGLNGICGTLRYSVNSLGFTGPAIANAVSIALILFLIWILYFDGFKSRLPPGRARRQLFLWLHLPFHLVLIITFEGMKNWLLFTNFIEAFARFMTAITRYQADNRALVMDAGLDAVLGKIGMSWNQEVSDALAATQQGLVAAELQIYRWFATVLHNIILLYVANPDPLGEYLYNQYMTNDTLVESGLVSTDGALMAESVLFRFILQYNEILGYSSSWIVTFAGGILTCIGSLNTIQLKPTDKYAWGSALNKKTAGYLLFILGLTGLGGRGTGAIVKSTAFTMLPSIAIVYATVAFVNQVLLVLSVRSIKTQETAVWGHLSTTDDNNDQLSGATKVSMPIQNPHTQPSLSESQSWQVLPFLADDQGPPIPAGNVTSSPEIQMLHQDNLV